jgi:putative addiction module component (TIGR02574 family)
MPFDDWREQIEAGALRLSASDRAALLERLVVAHESYYEITALWVAEAERRMEEVRAGRMKLIPIEVTLEKLRAIVDKAADNATPPIPETIDEIEDEALHLAHDEFYLLLTNLEAGLPAEIDTSWRGDIRRRIAAIPGELERRCRECNGDWADDESG